MSEEMRKEFEEWFSSYCNERGFNYSFATLLNGEYASWPEHNAYVGWQASREAMKPIKLPEATSASTFFGGRTQTSMYIKECEVISAIESAGYKVAP